MCVQAPSYQYLFYVVFIYLYLLLNTCFKEKRKYKLAYSSVRDYKRENQSHQKWKGSIQQIRVREMKLIPSDMAKSTAIAAIPHDKSTMVFDSLIDTGKQLLMVHFQMQSV